MNRLRWHQPDEESPAFDFDFPPTPREEREEIDELLRLLRPEPIADATLRRLLGRAGIALAPERRPGRSAVREAFCLGLSAACLAVALLWPCLSPGGHNADHRPLSCPGGTFSR
jgi:hypothetical protein